MTDKIIKCAKKIICVLLDADIINLIRNGVTVKFVDHSGLHLQIRVLKVDRDILESIYDDFRTQFGSGFADEVIELMDFISSKGLIFIPIVDEDEDIWVDL